MSQKKKSNVLVHRYPISPRQSCPNQKHGHISRRVLGSVPWCQRVGGILHRGDCGGQQRVGAMQQQACKWNQVKLLFIYLFLTKTPHRPMDNRQGHHSRGECLTLYWTGNEKKPGYIAVSRSEGPLQSSRSLWFMTLRHVKPFITLSLFCYPQLLRYEDPKMFFHVNSFFCNQRL